MTDDEWSCLAPPLPQPRSGGRSRGHPRCAIRNAIFYGLRSGCAWRLLPHARPPWTTESHYCRLWRRYGLWEQLHSALREEVRVQAGRNSQPSAAIMANPLLKTTDVGGVRGCDGAKQLRGAQAALAGGYPRAGLAGQGPQYRYPGGGRCPRGVGGHLRGVSTAGACLGRSGLHWERKGMERGAARLEYRIRCHQSQRNRGS
jgi:transposase